MKKYFFIAAFLCLYTSISFCQKKEKDIFNIERDIIGRAFKVALPQNEKIVLELGPSTEISDIKNLDSLMDEFILAIKPLKDSLQDGIDIKRIDYVIDASENKKIKLTKYAAGAQQYVSINGTVSLLKTGQDTVSFISNTDRTHFYRVSFYLNHLTDLGQFTDGMLNEIITRVEEGNSKGWKTLKDGSVTNKKYEEISAATPYGVTNAKLTLELGLNVSVQNFESKLLPSMNLSLGINRNTVSNNQYFGIYSETPVVFARNDNGNRIIPKNSFGGINYIYKSKNKNSFLNNNGIVFPYITLGYLVNRDGDYFDKNTFQVGFSKFTFLKDRLSIEPTFFVSKNYILPSIRLTVPIL